MMSNSAEVLVIILSCTLTVFLICGIVAIIYVIRTMRQVRRISEHAEKVAGSMESAASTFERSATPLAALKIFSEIFNNASKFRKRKD